MTFIPISLILQKEDDEEEESEEEEEEEDEGEEEVDGEKVMLCVLPESRYKHAIAAIK